MLFSAIQDKTRSVQLGLMFISNSTIARICRYQYEICQQAIKCNMTQLTNRLVRQGVGGIIIMD